MVEQNIVVLDTTEKDPQKAVDFLVNLHD